MTLDLKKNKNIKQPNIPKPINPNKTQPAITKLTKENYEKLQKLTESGFVQIHKNENIPLALRMKTLFFYIIRWQPIL